MGTRESRLQRGRRLGEQRARALVDELRTARRTLGLSQQAVADATGRSQSDISRLERCVGLRGTSLVELSEIGAALGLELRAGFHPAGVAIRDRGHQALIGRFRAWLHSGLGVAAEVALPGPGDPRTWDLVLRIGSQRVGVEAETRIRDVQALSRRLHQRQRDGGTDVVLLVLSDSEHNRLLVGELRASLGPDFATNPRQLIAALRTGTPLRGSGVILA
jgi:transcriptional regulator with XRE-family HTH domain